MMDESTLWRYPDTSGYRDARVLTGLKVEARDGDVSSTSRAGHGLSEQTRESQSRCRDVTARRG
jgi:hypothetical protein